jgi:hypothetical protein
MALSATMKRKNNKNKLARKEKIIKIKTHVKTIKQ